MRYLIPSELNFIPFNIDNAVTVLDEIAEKEMCSIPEYFFAGPERIGYDTDGNPKWFCRCTIINDETGIVRSVWASSKTDAKKAAAYLVLCAHFHARNGYGANGTFLGWNYKNGKLMPYTSIAAS